jgi:hypothetical protein
MQYTADELKGAGTPIKNPLIAGNTYTFTLYRPQNQTGLSTYLSGSGYFTVETIGDANRHYPSSLTKLAEGTHDNPDGSNTLISSSYIFSYELNTNGSTPQTSSFTFVPDNTISIGQVMFRATGDYDMDVSPIEGGCGETENYDGGPSYPTTLDITLGSDTGTVGCLLDPLSVPDRFIVTWDGDIVIDTGYLSTPFGVSDQYNVGGTLRTNFTNQLTGREAPEGGTYPLPPGGSGNNIISSDGYPEVFVKDAPNLINFTKDNSTSAVRVDIYAPMTGTGWNVRVDCPV